MSSAIIVEQRGPVLEVTLNRPEKYNALTLEMLTGLMEATLQFAELDELRVLLVRAAGAYFCAGIDLKGELAPDDSLTSPRKFRHWYRGGAGTIGSIHPLGNEWEAIEKPIVIAHQGPCLGAGLELSLSADFRFATPDAAYQLPEIAFAGLPGSGGTSRLVRLIGTHWARWLILANQKISAERALAVGLVHEIFAADQFDARVREFCDQLAATPPEAFAAGKLAIELVAELSRAEGRNVERLAVSSLYGRDEFREALQAVKDRLFKRKPT